MSTDARVILGIDPGPEESACVWFDGTRVEQAGMYANADVPLLFRPLRVGTRIAIEGFVPYGQSLGMESIRTIEWIGVFRWEAGRFLAGVIPRPEIKHELCGTRRARDADVRDALIHRFGLCRKEAVGTKKTPGPLFGITKHKWAALAVAVVAFDRFEPQPERST